MDGSPVGRHVLLAIGYLALAIAILAARNAPAGGYELSIYTATPLATWVALGTALLIGLVLSFVATTGRGRLPELALSVLAVATFVAMPLVRGYYFHGTGDPMTHLGWARDFSTGTLVATGLHYPGVHSFAVFVNELTGMALPRSLILVTVAMTVAFFLFVPLCVRTITARYSAIAIAVFAALLLVPINTISMHMRTHPFTLTALFSALVLYLVFKYLTDSSGKRLGLVTPVGAVLALAVAATVFYHLQQALNLLIFFLAICAAQLFYRRYRNGHPIATHRPLYAQTGLFALVFGTWVSQVDWIVDQTTVHLTRIAGFFLTGAGAGEDIAGQGASLLAIAGPGAFVEVFVKLFLVSAIVSVVAGAFMLAELLGWLDDRETDANALIRYLTIALVPLTLLFVLYFLGAVSEMYFRHLGFIMVILTVVGAVAIERGARFLAARTSTRHLQLALICCFVVMLPLSLASVFSSPFIYHPNEHVSEASLGGHEVVFATHGGDEESLASIRGIAWRFSDGVHGVENSHDYSVGVPEGSLSSLHTFHDDGGHVVVTQHDYEREVMAYREVRFTSEEFASLERQPGVNRVVSNGEVRLYHVNPRSP